MKYKRKKSMRWFMDRIGKELIHNNEFNLFAGTVRVESEGHAKALCAHQDKGHRYSHFNL